MVTGRYDNAFALNSVEMVRGLENQMLNSVSNYDAGRLGAEIAYAIADKKLGLKDIVLEEPSLGGRDLYTQDGIIAIQARLLRGLGPDNIETDIQNALLSLVKKLQVDYSYNPQMVKGYAILSYFDVDGGLKSIILEVPKV